MSESWETKFKRWGFNLFPAYRRTGGRITYIRHDFREIIIQVPLNWKTRNYVGTIFGGSMFGAVDPIYMVMLIQIFGRSYEIWDKKASIRFRKPGRSTLTAQFQVDEEEITTIKEILSQQEKADRTYHIDLVDEDGDICAEVEKVIFFRRKD